MPILLWVVYPFAIWNAYVDMMGVGLLSSSDEYARRQDSSD